MLVTSTARAGLVKIHDLINDAKCFEVVRSLRWPEGVLCPHCENEHVIEFGRYDTQEDRQRYRCKPCGRCFDDLTGMVFESHHLPLRTWILCLYFKGLNLSNSQISKELDLNKDDVQNTPPDPDDHRAGHPRADRRADIYCRRPAWGYDHKNPSWGGS